MKAEPLLSSGKRSCFPSTKSLVPQARGSSWPSWKAAIWRAGQPRNWLGRCGSAATRRASSSAARRQREGIAERIALEAAAFTTPDCAYVSHHTDWVHDAAEARQEALAAQIASTVRWGANAWTTLSVPGNRLAFWKIGPGQALARMWNETIPGCSGARSCDEFHGMAGIAKWVAVRS